MAQCVADMGATFAGAPKDRAAARSLKGERSGPAFWVIVLFSLVAFGLRMTDLTSRVYWVDEGFTLYRVLGSWPTVFTNFVNLQGISTTDIHPPLYFAALKLWLDVGGFSEFGMRVFSVFWAVLLVPLTYALARKLFGARAALLAAALAVLCPAYQWYGWEIRMYTVTPAIAALTTYFLARAILGSRLRLTFLAGWLVASIVAIFTHYSSGSLFLAQAAFVVLVNATRFRRIGLARVAGLAMLLAGVAAMLLLFPGPSATVRQAMSLAWSTLRQPSGVQVPFLYVVHEALGASTFGMNAADPTGGWLEVLIAALVVIGLVLPISRDYLRRRALLALSIATPIAFWTALSYFLENPPTFRYVIIVVPMMHVVLGYTAGLVWTRLKRYDKPGEFRRWARIAASAIITTLIIVLNTFGLASAFVRTPTWQDNWLELTRYIRQEWQPGDALMINLYTPELVMKEYLGDLPIDILFARQWFGTAGVSELSARLQSRYTRIWHANTGGDGGYMSAEVRQILAPFDRRGRTTFNARTNILQLDRYDTATPSADALPADAIPLRAPAGDTATHIAGYRLSPGSPYGTTNSAHLSLYWARGSTVPDNASVSIRLRDVKNDIWMTWQVASELRSLPPSCVPGRICRTDHTLLLPAGLPPIRYSLDIGEVSESGRALAPAVSTSLSSAEIACCLRVRAGPSRAPALESPGVALVLAEYPPVIRPGNALPVVLTWMSKQPAGTAWQVRLSLASLIGDDLASVERIAGPPDLRPAAWPTNEWIRDQYSLQAPSLLKPGLYRLNLARMNEGRVLGALLVGIVRVEEHPRSPPLPAGQFAVNVQIGPLTLTSFDARLPIIQGAQTELRTLWRVNETPGRDGTLFVHVIGPDGRLVAQDDIAPEQGARSTLSYLPGDGIELTHRFTLPGNLPAGDYRIYSGVYDRVGGERWPAISDGAPAWDNLAPLLTFTIGETPKRNRAFLPAVTAGALP